MPDTKIPACGRWRIGPEIGRGAYGVVYLATGPDGDRAAIKVCRRSDVGDERYERELRGTKLYSSIPSQEGLVRMREFAEEPWGFYAVMDLADDEFGNSPDSSDGYRPKTLASVIEGEKAIPLKECVKLALSLAKGLAVLQRHHLLHRDIKPGNVLYVGGRPVLSDPGLIVEESEAASLVGTPGYVPPEKFTAAASDIYSLGRTLKAASFGRQVEDLDKGPAMEADTGAALFPVWWRILNKATDPTPSRRYQSAKALLRDLKVLRLKVAFTTSPRSWIIREAIVVGVVLLIVFSAAKFYMWKMTVEAMSGNQEIASLKQFKSAWDKKVYYNQLKDYWEKGATSFYAWSQSYELTHALRFTKVTTYDTNLVARIGASQMELAEIRKKSRKNAERFGELRKIAEEKYAKGADISELMSEAKKIIDGEAALKQRVLEIGRSFYKNWKPSPLLNF